MPWRQRGRRCAGRLSSHRSRSADRARPDRHSPFRSARFPAHARVIPFPTARNGRDRGGGRDRARPWPYYKQNTRLCAIIGAMGFTPMTALADSIDRLTTGIGRAVAWLVLVVVLLQFGLVVTRYAF